MKTCRFPGYANALMTAGYEIPEVAEDYSLADVPEYSGHLILAALPLSHA